MYEIETHYLDIGQGDCSIIVVRETETYAIKRVVVYDCGSGSGDFAAKKLLQKCEILGIETIDVAIISHFDRDHFNGFNSLFHMGNNKKNRNSAFIRALFRDTKLYTQGCIFQKYKKETIDKKEINRFLSAYYFKRSTSKSKESILRDYTEFLSLISTFKEKLDELDQSGNYSAPNQFGHLTERMLAGFPTSDWRQKNYPEGLHNVFLWDPTIKIKNEKEKDNFTKVNFDSGDTLLGKDLLNEGFDEELEGVHLWCVAVNTHIFDSVGLLRKTTKPTKKGNIANNMSVGCLLVYENYSAFFGGDLEKEIEDKLISTILHSSGGLGLSVLKAGHHGSNKSTSVKFLNGLSPLRVVITCGEQNVYNHPALELIKRLHDNPFPEQIIIAGFGVRRRTEADEKKKKTKKRKTQNQLDFEFFERIFAYQKLKVPVNATDIFQPNSKFILAGTFNQGDDGSITVTSVFDELEGVHSELSFQHAFTRIELIKTNGNEQLSRENSVKMLTERNAKNELVWSIEDDDFGGMQILSGKKRSRPTSFDIDLVSEEVILPTFKKKKKSHQSIPL